jgi:ectoine hydroxylase-related dioxygenase (phytanoyl-CoA dioxygenase family)
MKTAAEEIEKNGFALIKGLLSPSELSQLEDFAAIFEAQAKEKGGGRNIFQKAPSLLPLFKTEAILNIVRTCLGPNIGISEGIYLNKKDEANWLVAWHQDLFISVKQKIESEGFHSWTNKQGIPYVQPPVEVLGQSLWVRLNLDKNGIENGCLRVSPGTHNQGKIASEAHLTAFSQFGDVAIPCNKGDAILFKPLLLHASSKSMKSGQRRVFQVLFSGFQFKNGLEWPY